MKNKKKNHHINRTGYLLIVLVALIVVLGVVYSVTKGDNESLAASIFNTTPRVASATPAPINGACGTSNGAMFSTTPTVSLCASGMAGAVTATANGWTWTCSGLKSSLQCSAKTLVCPQGQVGLSSSKGGPATCVPFGAPNGGLQSVPADHSGQGSATSSVTQPNQQNLCAYVTDNDSFATHPKPTVKVFTLAGSPVRQWQLAFQAPTGITVDSSGGVYVANGDLHNPLIQKFSSTGTLIGSPWVSGLVLPTWIKASPTGNVYVLDGKLLSGNSFIKEYTPSGALVTQWGAGNAFYLGLSFDALNNVYVSDNYTNKMYSYSPSGSSLGQWGNFPTGTYPLRVAKNTLNNNLYVTVNYPSSQIRQYTTTGTLINQWNATYSIEDVAVDPLGYVYVLDISNGMIKKYSPSGSLVTQWNVSKSMMGIAIGACN